MDRKLALVTGASAGIGAAFARLLAAKGYDLALTARRAGPMEALAADLRDRHGVGVQVIAADLADPAAPAALVAALGGRPVDALINNAGYGLVGAWHATTWADQAAFMQVMMTAPSDLAHRLLPAMRERRFGRIVNVASLAGFVPASGGHTLYAAVKAYLIKFSESLYDENRDAGVHVSALCPGLTWSEFHDANGSRARMDRTPRFMWMAAEPVVAAGWAAVEAGRPICIPGAVNQAAFALARVLPETWGMAIMSSGGERVKRGQ